MKKNKKNSSEEYWETRVLEDEAIKEKRGQEQAKLQEEAYKIALLEIQGTIRKYERMFAENNYLGNIQEANKLLNSEELEEYKWDVYKYIKEAERYANTKDKYTPEMIKLDTQLRNSSLRYRIRKQEALKKIVESKLLNLAQRNIHTLTNDLKAQADITVDNVKSDFIRQNIPLKNDIDISKVENKVLNEKWVDNKRYSERIWKNTKELGLHIDKEVQKAIILGKNPKTLIKALKERFKVESWKAKRLALTEMSYSLNKSRMLTFLSQGVEKVVLIATLDLRTSKICINKNNKVVKLKGAKQGIDLPPFHPHCRTVFVPVIDFLEDTNFYDNEDEDLKPLLETIDRKARDPIDNKSYTTGIKDYKQWENSKTPGANATITQVHKDRHLDKQNYKKLKKVLKNQDYFPNTLAEYRKMRYNNVEEHKELLNTYDNKLEYQNFMKTFKRHQVPTEYLPKDFEEFNNIKKNILNDSIDNVLKYEKLKFRNKILKEKEQGKQKLHKGHQNKHQLNSNEYISARDKGNPRVYKSYLLKNGDPMDNNKKEYYSYVEELYKEAAGRGELIIDTRKTIPEIKEYYKFDRIIGKSNLAINKLEKRPVPPENFNYKNTSIIQIKYSSRGYHVVPIDDKEE